MSKGQGKIMHFKIEDLNEVSVTHGYDISNAFPVHFHSSYNLGFIESGKREFSYRGKNNILLENDIFIIQPFEPHSCKSFEHAKHSYKILSFKIDLVYFFPEFKIKDLGLLNELKEFHHLIENNQTLPLIIELYNSIIEQIVKLATEPISTAHSEQFISKIENAKKFIEEKCLDNISLKKMSDIACLSEFHFNRYFHKYYGISPYAYYLICKIKKAQNILKKHKSIIDTSYNIGLFDQSHFTKLFKKHTGVTPGKFLRDNR